MDLQPFLEAFAQLPPKLQQRLAAELKIDVAKATPAGAVLIGFSLAQTFGVGETIDYLLGDWPREQIPASVPVQLAKCSLPIGGQRITYPLPGSQRH
ncbi:MAG: hypothetical protein M1609_15995 [Firmicutes bacterium]|nr:hypothetical protein [Bacillota bacterium]